MLSFEAFENAIYRIRQFVGHDALILHLEHNQAPLNDACRLTKSLFFKDMAFEIGAVMRERDEERQVRTRYSVLWVHSEQRLFVQILAVRVHSIPTCAGSSLVLWNVVP